MSEETDDSIFEQQLASRVAIELLAEQRRARRWGIFFKFLFAIYLLGALAIYMPNKWPSAPAIGEHTALVDIEGIIAADSNANADYVVSGLRAAFKDKKTAAVILRMNSPGGSPVHAGYINDEIHRLRKEHPNIPVYSVIVDICASGGYYIAVAADEIYADKASIIGSIGVIMSGFGFVDTLEKIGVERRLLHAGENKGFLDPFSPLKQGDVSHVETLLSDIHQQFIEVVKKGRGDKLQGGEQIFSGLIWTGEQSLELGLIDGLGSAAYVAREVVGAEEIVDFTRRESYLDKFVSKLGSAIAKSFQDKQLKLQ